jgi:hypothetical protein
MADITHDWLTLEQASKHFGYSHPENLRQRLRDLRKRGQVIDIGKPPAKYEAAKREVPGKVIIYWPNARTALMRRDVPGGLLIPKRGKRARNSDS